jgi:S-adenosylmethionine decarboxylase proenzyme
LNTHGKHLLVEYVGCSFSALDDVVGIQAMMERAACAARMTIVASVFKPFIPQGVSGVVIVEESHISIHTWPEVGYAAVDCYTCGAGDPEAAFEALRIGLESQYHEIVYVQRGLNPTSGPSNCMRMVSHTRNKLKQKKLQKTQLKSARLV